MQKPTYDDTVLWMAFTAGVNAHSAQGEHIYREGGTTIAYNTWYGSTTTQRAITRANRRFRLGRLLSKLRQMGMA